LRLAYGATQSEVAVILSEAPVILSEAPVILSEAPVILSEARDLAWMTSLEGQPSYGSARSFGSFLASG
jgi:hypothetical protein